MSHCNDRQLPSRYLCKLTGISKAQRELDHLYDIRYIQHGHVPHHLLMAMGIFRCIWAKGEAKEQVGYLP